MRKDIKLDFETQLHPIDQDQENYIIHDLKELIKQIKSLKLDARINSRNELHQAIFYKDYNALSIVLNLLRQLED